MMRVLDILFEKLATIEENTKELANATTIHRGTIVMLLNSLPVDQREILMDALSYLLLKIIEVTNEMEKFERKVKSGNTTFKILEKLRGIFKNLQTAITDFLRCK